MYLTLKRCSALQVVFPALLPLTYIPAFLERIRQLFLSLFQPYVSALVASLSAGSVALGSAAASLADRGQSALRVLQAQIRTQNWEGVLLRCLRRCEGQGKASGIKAVPKRETRAMTAARRAEMAAANTASDSAEEEAQARTGATAATAEEIAKNVHALKGRMKGGKGRGARGG